MHPRQIRETLSPVLPSRTYSIGLTRYCRWSGVSIRNADGPTIRAMRYFYGEYDGTDFPTQDKLFGFDQLMQFIMQYGEQALKAIEQMMNDPKNEAQAEMLEQLLKDGMLDKDGKGKL